MIKMLVAQPNPGPAIMPWLNRYHNLLLTISEPLHSDSEIFRTAETISIHPLKKISSTTSIAKKSAHVAFSDLIDVRKVPPTGTLAQSSRSTLWWTREDYSRMRLNNKDVLTKMTDNRLPISDRSSRVCTLGLETYSGLECQKRRERKSLVTKAVLKAQEQHKMEGIRDPVFIAEISRSITRASAEEAYLRASDGMETEIPRIEESTEDQDFVEIRI